MIFLGVFLSGLGLAAVSSAYIHEECPEHWLVTDSALEDALFEIAADFPPDHVIERGWSYQPGSKGDTVLRTKSYSKPTIVGPIQRYCRRACPTVAATFKGSWDVTTWKAYGENLNATIDLRVEDVTFTIEFKLHATPENGTFALRPVSAIPIWRGEHSIDITSDLPRVYEFIIESAAEFLFSVFANNLFTNFMEYRALQVLRVATENAEPFVIA